MILKHIEFNKGCYITAEDTHPVHGIVERGLATSCSLAKCNELINQYGNGVITVGYKTLQQFVKQDSAKFTKRLEKLISMNDNLTLEASFKNIILYGLDGTEYKQDYSFIAMISYQK